MTEICYAIAIGFLFAHELDAIDKKEWKLFFILKDIAPEKAHKIFVALHIPFGCLLIFPFLPSFSEDTQRVWIFCLLAFFVVHGFLHFFFRKKKDYKFEGILSNIYLIGISLFGGLGLLSLV